MVKQQYPGKGGFKDFCIFITFIQIIKVVLGGLNNLNKNVLRRKRVSYNLTYKRQPLITGWGILIQFFVCSFSSRNNFWGVTRHNREELVSETLKSLWKSPDLLLGVSIKAPIKSVLPQTKHSKYLKRILIQFTVLFNNYHYYRIVLHYFLNEQNRFQIHNK